MESVHFRKPGSGAPLIFLAKSETSVEHISLTTPEREL